MSVHSMVINMMAQTAGFDRNVTKSAQKMRSFEGTVTSVGRSIRRMAVGLLAVAGIGGLGFMFKKTMDNIDATGKLARNLDISTEALLGFRHAANISGIEAGAFDKSISMMIKRLAEATTGTGEAKDGLEMLGMTADYFTGMGTEQSFLTIADSISRVADASKRAYIAYTIFGRQGQQMLSMFENGKVGIQQMRAELERLGGTYSMADALQVEAANDAFARMRTAFNGIIQKLTIELAPYLEAFADQLTKAGTKGQGMGDAIVNAMEAVSVSIGKAIDYVRSLKDEWVLLKITLPFGSDESKAKKYAAYLESQTGGSEAESAEAFFANIRANAANRASMAASAKPPGVAIDTEAIEAFSELAKAADKLKESLKSPIEKFKEMRAEYDKMKDAGLISQEIYDQALRKAGVSLSGTSGAKGGGSGSFLEVGQGVSVSGLSIGSADPALQKLDESNSLASEQVSLLREIANKDVLGF